MNAFTFALFNMKSDSYLIKILNLISSDVGCGEELAHRCLTIKS